MTAGHRTTDEDFESKEKFLSCFKYAEEIASFHVYLINFTPVGKGWSIIISPRRQDMSGPKLSYWTGDNSDAKCETRELAYMYLCKLSEFLDRIGYEYIIEPRMYIGGNSVDPYYHREMQGSK